MTSVARDERAGAVSVHWYRGRRAQETIARGAAFIVLSLGAFMIVVPFVWMVSSALKTNETVFNPNWIPSPIAWSNFREALTSAPFDVYAMNTLKITVLSTAGAVLSSSLVAYSFARLRWPGRDLWFGVVLATMMLPGAVTMIPTYILFSTMHWVNTFRPLIVPAWLGGGAFFIFMLRQFYRTIPLDLSEAARIDGAGEVRIWWQIVMPLSRPALTAVAIFAFNGSWEDYFGPLLYLNSESKYTLQLGLTTFAAGGGGGIPQWNYMMAASLVIILPVLILFFVGQRYFIEGVTLTGIKG